VAPERESVHGQLRVAVVGLGLIGRQRAQALARIESATLAATVDPAAASPAVLNPVPASPAALDGAPHYPTLAELSRERYDAAVVAVPHDMAPAIVSAVLGAGRPVLVEKPLSVRGAQARELEALAATLQLPSFVGFNYRFLPAIGELLECVEAGALGELRNIDMLVGHGGHPHSASGWKLNPARAGGGVLLDPGVHLLDLLLALAPSVACASIEATRGFWRTGIEEDVVAVFRDARLIATLRVSHIRWVNSFRVEVFGEDGYAIAEGRGGNYGPMTLRLGRRWAWRKDAGIGQRESEVVREYGSDNDSLYDELAHVVARWRGAPPEDGGSRPATMGEARSVTELCERLYERLA
jgi:1,5-anhydro-D-fructose reductase (1,5-anhydro-D-mannitol-forming)